ncbi:MAG: Rrf2 family transcriptional regulator [Termitinemataceae bacterium]|nr:MAG: Rrf2 family transcriptional regulator [Termitinemataceae bacterium]
MRISTKGRYSLEAVLLLALTPKDQYLSIREISEKTGVSEGYLEQLFILLRKSDIIQGIRGSQGGYFMEKPPNDITIGDILRTVEGSLKPAPCVDKKFCPNENTCTSHSTWNALYTAINEYIDSITVFDLVSDYSKNLGTEYSI